MKGISCCGDCGYYNWKKHKCTRAVDKGAAQDHFYADCPLPDVVPITKPRVLSLDEYRANAEMPRSERVPVWVEWRDGSYGWAIPQRAYEVYGVGWRAWTDRPTEEMREAVEWE